MAYPQRPIAAGCRVYLYWGCSAYVSDETLTKDNTETHVHWFANYPVSTRRCLLAGHIGADWEFIVNAELEPLTGRLTCAAVLPEYDSVHAWYYYYENYELNIMTQGYQVLFPKWSSEISIWGQPKFADHNNYPHEVPFRIVLDTEAARNLLSESMFLGCYFLLIDKGIPEGYGIRAFEGPLHSDEQGSLYKGASYLLPVELQPQNFGGYEPELSGLMTSAADPAGGWTRIALANHGLSEDDWIEITGSTFYDDKWEVRYFDANNVDIHIAFAGNDTGAWIREAQITWGAWERT